MSSHRGALYLLLVVAALATGLLHVAFVPRYFPEDALRASVVLLAGWFTFALAFYVAGRLFSHPGELPSMRGADLGIGLFLVSALVALFLDSLGFPPEAVLGAYALPAVGIYAGLALIGWAIGKRTAAINRIAGAD
ncbi:hypothetical protein [Salinilacihabitans rarus]|uniref:hypothetical protein n=1 Tax=Salinilacihabitans rarus TaxID=2961596 RepID=UPI0020C8B74A|nr:hypothetical protein [Salinilacihabitans rarus]